MHSEGNFPPRLLCVYKSDSLRLGDEYMDTGIFRIHKLSLPSVCVWIRRQQGVWTVYSGPLTQQAGCFYLSMLQIHTIQAARLQSDMKTFTLLR